VVSCREPRAEPGRAASAAALALLLLAACGGTDPGCSEHEDFARDRVPVVLFLVDTLRADRLGCYGHDRATSPRLDAFAEGAVTFESCFANSTWTKPATASILTGLWPSEHGAVHAVSSLPAAHVTLAETLSEAGYSTAGFGANGFVFAPAHGFEQGFDVFESSWKREEDDGRDPLRADVVVDAALAWLRAHDGGPFLLYLHVVDPHDPYTPPEGWRERFSPVRSEGPWDDERLSAPPSAGTSPPTDALQRMLDLYDAEIAFADAQFGRLLDELEASGHGDSLVLFLSDHGEEFLDHAGWGHNPRMYQEVLRVPLVVRFPGEAHELTGVRHGAAVSQIDVLPTILDTLDIRVPDAAEGRSLLEPLFCSSPPPPLVLAESDYRGEVRKALVHERWKYVRAWAPDELELLFDLESDPGEERNLVEEHRAEADSLRSMMSTLTGPERTGWGLVYRNGSDARVEVVGALLSDEPLASIDALRLELRGTERPDKLIPPRRIDGERPLEWMTRFVLSIAPGDHDGIVFRTESDQEVRIVLLGESGPIETLRLGASGTPVELPFSLDTGRGDLGLAEPGLPPTLDSGSHAWLWKRADVGGESVELSEETLEHLRALGYGGEE